MRRKILLVAGSADVLADMESAVAGIDADVALANGAGQALEMAANDNFTAIVLDMSSLGEGGLRLCRTWRDDGTGSLSAVLALTTPDAESRRAAFEAGAGELLTHPLNSVELEVRLAARVADGVTGAVDLLAHDLKSPMGTVISALELLAERERGADDSFRRLLDGALIAAKRQLNLIDDVLDLARMRKGAFQVSLTTVSLPDMVAEATAEVFHLVHRKGLELEIDVPDELPPVLADPHLLGRVFRAIFDNVLKFTVRGDKLRIEAEEREGRVVLSIRDTGRTVQEEYMSRIFDTDIQWEARQSGSRTSVALGLPFCLAAVRAMRGRITVGRDSRSGENVFKLDLSVADGGCES